MKIQALGASTDHPDLDTPADEEETCTYNSGYITQNVFVCYTCLQRDSTVMAGMCEECSNSCHVGHDIRDIGKKKQFKCDCGTRKYPDICCNLLPDKTDNTDNHYTQNFKLQYCTCGKSDDGELMLQCYVCTEWFHHQCLGIPNVEDETEEYEFICNGCILRQFSFLNKYPPESTAANTSKHDEDDVDILGVEAQPKQNVDEELDILSSDGKLPELGKIVAGGRFLPEEWHNRLRGEDRELLPQDEAGRTEEPPAPTNENRSRENAPIILRAPTMNTQQQPKLEKEESLDIDIDAEILKAKNEGNRDKARNLVYKKFLAAILKQSNLNRRVTITEEDVKQAIRRQGSEVIVSPTPPPSQNSQINGDENDSNNLKKSNSINGHSATSNNEENISLNSHDKVTGKRKLEINSEEEEEKEERAEKHQKVDPETTVLIEDEEDVSIVD